MKIYIYDYPMDLEFEIDEKLPPFDPETMPEQCRRTEIARAELAKHEYEAPHAPTDFVVEHVTGSEYAEQWELGS
jgi:hypothetical protein